MERAGLGGTKRTEQANVLHAETKKSKKLAVAMVQEHNLSPDKFEDVRRKAHLRGFKLVISAGRADDPNSTRGGVLILLGDTQ